MKRFKLNFILNLAVLGCGILFSQSALSAAKSNLESSPSPTRIRSDIIDIKRKSQTVTFLNNVVVEKDDSSLLAQKMIVLYEDKKKNAQGQKEESSIRRIDAYNNVKIFSEDFIASGDYGFYEPAKSIFVLEKNVIVNNGTSIASGDKFIYDTKTQKGHFVGKKNETSIAGNGGDKRVVVIIGNDLKDSKGKEKKKNNEF